MTHKKCSPGRIRICLLFAVALALSIPASASWKEKVLYSFQGGTDGSFPGGGLIFDKTGNLYGVTVQGGATNCPPGWCGTIYELSPPKRKGGAWTEVVLYVFTGHDQNDGSSPTGSLLADTAGNLYGVTGYGGSGPCLLFGTATGCGTVYELSPPKQKGGAWTETVLYNFQGGKDGDLPSGTLVLDTAGNLYGVTLFGGSKGTTCDIFYGGTCGTVFKLSPPKQKGGQWTEKVLHSFAGIAAGKQNGDGAVPNGGLVLDSKGAVYGTTFNGGYNCPHNSNQGCGTAFQLTRPTKRGGAWNEKVVHRFTGGNDGAGPSGGLVLDLKGRVYGTTSGGGSSIDGVVFRLAPRKNGQWVEVVLYAFKGGSDGDGPGCCLVFDPAGNLYGTAFGGLPGRGTVFRLRGGNQEWVFSLLHAFTGPPDGSYPESGLILGKSGEIYSTAQGGGTGQACQGGCGTVFEVSP
jgi:uncharacterized repeat protein (TIGR03803 family)